MVSHHWPGITPMNVWDMRLDMWLLVLAGVKRLKDEEIGWWG